MPRIKATPVRREVHRFEEEQLPPLQTFTETSLQDGESYVDLMGDDFIEDEESELHFGSEQGTAAEDAVDLTKDESPAPTKRARVANKPIHGQEWINIQPSTISSHELYPLPLRSEGQELWYLLQQKEIPVEDKTSPLQDSIPVTAAIHKDGLLLPFNESAVLIPIDGKLRNQLVEALRKEDLAIEVVMHANLLVLQYFVHQNSFVPLTLLQFILGKDNILNQTWSDSCPTQIMPGDVAFEFDAAAFLDELNATSNLEEDDEALLELENKLHALGLVTKLRKYQLEGVNWMNKVLNFEQDSYPCAENTVGMLRMNTLPDSSHDLYYSMIESKFTAMNRWIDQNQRSSKSCILADSMGIGKSIQILSLCMLLKEQLRQDSAAISVSVAKEEAILFHSSRRNPQDDLDEFIEFEEETPCVCGRITLTKQDLGWVQCSGCEKWRHIRCAGFQTAEEAEVEHDYLCLPCQAIYHHYHQLPSKCMLLIVPPTLVNQWQMEIKKHFSHAGDKSFKILTISSANLFTISPYDILKYDIIVMDFKALRTGFHAANIDWSNRQRGGKYDVFPPSFLAIHYQLVVIDETQNIESCSENQILKMSCKLRSERRVSVSGTPFGNNKLHDLYNLVQFLKIPPFDMDKHMWQTLFEQNNLFLAREVRLSWLKQLLQPIVLRRTKAMVSNQLQLKQGMTLLRPLKLSPFEVSYYYYPLNKFNNNDKKLS